jgi:L-seryl-tRNA(Ser) seleniumtransferase
MKTVERERPPSMDSLLCAPEAAPLSELYGREALKEELRRAMTEGEIQAASLIEKARKALARRFAPSLKPVINATGVLLHTNLGRAPLSPAAREALDRVAARYSTLEYDPESGERGRRQDHVRQGARDLFACEDVIAVNNNASAVFLALSALARGRRVLVSRGELVAIGGSFKIPEILEASGASLLEVGTTNRTTIADYRQALSPDVALILTVHPSNYEIRGYTARPEQSQIAALAREAAIPWIHDQGTGCVVALDEFGVPGEPTVASVLAAGADLLTFSGDKLFGGPQAGFLVGRARLVAQAAAHPIARVVRPDKLTLAALAATLAAWKTGHWRELPIYRRAGASLVSLEERGARIGDAARATCPRLSIEVAASSALFGGGTSPEKRFPSRALRVTHPRLPPEELARHLRRAETPVVGRVEEQSLWLDLRTIDPEEDAAVAAALSRLERAWDNPA